MELDIYALLKSLAVSFFGSLLDILGRLRVVSLWPLLTQPRGQLPVGLQMVTVTPWASVPSLWKQGAKPVDL